MFCAYSRCSASTHGDPKQNPKILNSHIIYSIYAHVFSDANVVLDNVSTILYNITLHLFESLSTDCSFSSELFLYDFSDVRQLLFIFYSTDSATLSVVISEM